MTRPTEIPDETSDSSAIDFWLLTPAKDVLVVGKSYLKVALDWDDVAYLVMKR